MKNFTNDSRQIVIVSPYHSGSHAYWADGLKKWSSHQVDLLTLPGRFWKWRMHGAAVTLADKFLGQEWQPDHVLATDMLDLSTFVALLRRHPAKPRFSLYMHENQLTYPLPLDPDKGPMRRQKGERDHHYVFINIASQLVADQIIFNSTYHRDSWFAALRPFLRGYPDHRLGGKIADLEKRSVVVPVGLNWTWLQEMGDRPDPLPDPLILWNQRWEYDKNPSAFFAALLRAKAAGLRFRLAVCGERFSRQPDAFSEFLPQLSEELVHEGYADPATYRRLLWQSDIVISTADHEFFGISILEAIACECYPILPYRLSYPELLPAARTRQFLYRDDTELDKILARVLSRPAYRRRLAIEAAAHVARFRWSEVSTLYDALWT